MNAMTGKSLSLVEGDEQVAELLDGGEATENDTVATTSSIGAEQSTSAHHDEESDLSPVAYMPESILPDLKSESEAEDEEIHISDMDNDERPVIKRGKKWQKRSPIKIVGNPISLLASPPSTSRWMREDEFPPPPKRGTPKHDAWWKLCERDYEIEENYRNGDTKRGMHGRPLSIYNSTREVEGPACLFCYQGGLEYPSARKYSVDASVIR